MCLRCLTRALQIPLPAAASISTVTPLQLSALVGAPQDGTASSAAVSVGSGYAAEFREPAPPGGVAGGTTHGRLFTTGVPRFFAATVPVTPVAVEPAYLRTSAAYDAAVAAAAAAAGGADKPAPPVVPDATSFIIGPAAAPKAESKPSAAAASSAVVPAIALPPVLPLNASSDVLRYDVSRGFPIAQTLPLHADLKWSDLCWDDSGVTIRGARYPLRCIKQLANTAFARPGLASSLAVYDMRRRAPVLPGDVLLSP